MPTKKKIPKKVATRHKTGYTCTVNKTTVVVYAQNAPAALVRGLRKVLREITPMDNRKKIKLQVEVSELGNITNKKNIK